MRLISRIIKNNNQSSHKNCSNKCQCKLCLELKQDSKLSSTIKTTTTMSSCGAVASLRSSNASITTTNGNFILRRALPYVTRTPTQEWQEASDDDLDYERKATLPEDKKIIQQQQHKSVVYFGDTAKRSKLNSQNESNNGSQSAVSKFEGKVACTVVKVEEEDIEPASIVISVKPGREDVVKIEQDDNGIQHDYWPDGNDIDNSSEFKADWSFVQRWRLRG